MVLQLVPTLQAHQVSCQHLQEGHQEEGQIQKILKAHTQNFKDGGKSWNLPADVCSPDKGTSTPKLMPTFSTIAFT